MDRGRNLAALQQIMGHFNLGHAGVRSHDGSGGRAGGGKALTYRAPDLPYGATFSNSHVPMAVPAGGDLLRRPSYLTRTTLRDCSRLPARSTQKYTPGGTGRPSRSSPSQRTPWAPPGSQRSLSTFTSSPRTL